MVRSPRIELGTPAWKAEVLPLNYDRVPARKDAPLGGGNRQASGEPLPRDCATPWLAAEIGPEWVCRRPCRKSCLLRIPMSHAPSPDRYSNPVPLPPLRPQRREAPASLARPLAQFRGRRQLREQPGAGPAGLRQGHHPFRPREQLRPAPGIGRDDVRTDPAGGTRRVPRRAHRLDQGGL